MRLMDILNFFPNKSFLPSSLTQVYNLTDIIWTRLKIYSKHGDILES